MKFESIKLHNFMRYKGDNTLTFSTDSQKNVTCILGNNTAGKTSLVQAFRWVLYGDVTTTNYQNRKDIVLLNNEVIANMSMSDNRDVSVELVVRAGKRTYTFIRKQAYRKQNPDPKDLRVIPSVASLSMIISVNGVPGEIISDLGNSNKEYPPGCVRDTINNLFPDKLSNYFFFDGERWNENKNKTAEVKKSINTILGVSSIIKMVEHLRRGNENYKTTVIKKLNASVNSSSNESSDIKRKIESLETSVTSCEKEIADATVDYNDAKETYDTAKEILENNKGVEEDQRELRRLEDSIAANKRHMDSYYADIVHLMDSSDRYLIAELIPSINRVLSQVDLEGKDIPGVTSDTIDWLLKEGKCLCGATLEPGSEHYNSLLKLREEVYPNKIGGPAKLLKSRLEEYAASTETLVSSIREKASDFEDCESEIDSCIRKKERIEERIDRSRNMEEVRKRFNHAKTHMDQALEKKGKAEAKVETYKNNIASLERQLKVLESAQKANIPVYRAIEYANAICDFAENQLLSFEKPTIDELNALIAENFEKMFDSKEKYACLKDDYKIHMYYRSMGTTSEIEEKNLSNGETVAVNFVYIVSLLELAKKRRDAETTNDAVLTLPLVLDAPFSNLSNDNTGLVAKKLPEFAEQVIIFMLDKDWEASGLSQCTLPEYRYRISKDYTANNSTIIKDGGIV